MKKHLVSTNRIFKVCISVAAAFYIVFHGRRVNLLESLQIPIFYIALIVSFLVAFLMVNIIDYAHRWLEKRHDWIQESVKRSVAQFVMCVLLPLTVDIVLLSFYFYLLGTNIFDSGFVNHDFPVIVLFILIVNFYYITVSLFAEKEMNGLTYNTVGSENNPEFDNRTTLTIKHDGLYAQFDVKNEVLYFYTKDRKIHLLTKLGKEYSFNHTSIAELEEQLQAFDFCKIKRSVLVNCDAIRGYSTTSQRDTFQLILKKEYEAIIPEENLEHFFISREFLARFKNRFEKI